MFIYSLELKFRQLVTHIIIYGAISSKNKHR